MAVQVHTHQFTSKSWLPIASSCADSQAFLEPTPSTHHQATICAASAGALIWHGRDLRRYRRLLSPPLQRLLTCPGVAALGRGVASMPASYAHQVRPLAVAGCWEVWVRSLLRPNLGPPSFVLGASGQMWVPAGNDINMPMVRMHPCA